MAPPKGARSPPLSSVKHHYHSAITVAGVTLTKPSHFSRSGCMLSDVAGVVFRAPDVSLNSTIDRGVVDSEAPLVLSSPLMRRGRTTPVLAFLSVIQKRGV